MSKYLLLLLLPFSLYSTNFYIDKDRGNDNNNGTLIEKPWSTLTNAISGSTRLAGGDTVFFKSVCIWSEKISILHSGIQSNPIVFSKYGSLGEYGINPIFIGTGISNLETTLKIQNQAYIQIENIDFKDIENTVFTNIEIIESNNITITKCNFNKSTSSGHAILIKDGSNSIKINRCSFQNLPYSGIRLDSQMGPLNDIYIYNCLFDSINTQVIEGHSAIQVSSYPNQFVCDLHIYNNIVKNCGTVGIGIDCDTGGIVENVNMYKNTVSGCGYNMRIDIQHFPNII